MESYIMYKSFNFLLYITLHTIATLHLIVIYTDYYELGFFVMYDVIIGLMLLVLTFINTILCHLNFGKSHILLLKFNPNLDKDYEYSDDLDDNDDDDEEEEEKDEKISEKLTRYWKFIKESFNSLV
ncbi:hypothetical protein RhiirA4_532364 [Rhizophagus irregularis]|uniref:Uncharacterized protein n=1 Tax=Rhizophagus irregularis TaxID=588596 RepID=A0A2I1GX69_9GLOM|nr:hypothetical protein RhiirA4_532364 [Rhizophagus irregularis]